MTISKNKKLFVISALILMFIFVSCLGNSDVSFMGKPLNSPQKEFVKHLEDKGFTLDGGSYKGKYLDEDVFIILSKEADGHYNSMIVSSVFKDRVKAQDYFEKVCKTIAKEHHGFDEEDSNSQGILTREFTNKNGGSIKVSFAAESNIIAMVVAVFDVNVDDNKNNE